jgi:hypothetical protein
LRRAPAMFGQAGIGAGPAQGTNGCLVAGLCVRERLLCGLQVTGNVVLAAGSGSPATGGKPRPLIPSRKSIVTRKESICSALPGTHSCFCASIRNATKPFDPHGNSRTSRDLSQLFWNRRADLFRETELSETLLRDG